MLFRVKIYFNFGCHGNEVAGIRYLLLNKEQVATIFEDLHLVAATIEGITYVPNWGDAGWHIGEPPEKDFAKNRLDYCPKCWDILEVNVNN